MSEQRAIEEKLGVIRSFLERGPIYRAIFARAALAAGLLSLLAAGAIYLNNETAVTGGRPIRSREFALIWITVLTLSSVVSALFFWREAQTTGRAFMSAGLKLAVRAVAPYLVIPAVYTAWFLTTGYMGGDRLTLVVIWVASYGLALLSIELVAPRSLVLLGWVFLLTSLSIPIVLEAIAQGYSPVAPNYIMGISFGLYHLVYAAATWRRVPSMALN